MVRNINYLPCNSLRNHHRHSFFYAIGLTFIYYVFMSLCLSLGYGGLLPPLVAAWMANITFLIVGLLVLLQADD